MNEGQLIRDLRAGEREVPRLLYESHKDPLFALARVHSLLFSGVSLAT